MARLLVATACLVALALGDGGGPMDEGLFYYDDGLPDEGGMCTAEVDEERMMEWGENTADPKFQLYFLFPNWVKDMQVLITLGAQRCRTRNALAVADGLEPSGCHPALRELAHNDLCALGGVGLSDPRRSGGATMRLDRRGCALVASEYLGVHVEARS